MIERDFDGFQRLFSKFINETGPSVHWDKIDRLPEGAVNFLEFTIIYFILINNYLDDLSIQNFTEKNADFIVLEIFPLPPSVLRRGHSRGIKKNMKISLCFLSENSSIPIVVSPENLISD